MMTDLLEELGSNLHVEPSKFRQPKGMPETVRIVLEENDKIPPGGQFFGLNGRTWMLQPGVEVEVPRGIIDLLENAVETVPVIHPHTRQPIGWKSRLRFAYRRIDKYEPRRAA